MRYKPQVEDFKVIKIERKERENFEVILELKVRINGVFKDEINHLKRKIERGEFEIDEFRLL